MDEILSIKHYRRTFFCMVLLLLFVTLLIRFFALPYFDKTQGMTFVTLLATLLDNLVISMIVAVSLGSFIFWITPDIVKRSQIEVLAPKQINLLLKTATISTRSWIFKGACGRYTRSTTIPMMAERARIEGIGRDITLCILNPKNEALCSAYATYRRSLRSASDGMLWTRQSVQEEILATAITAMKYQFSEPLLRIYVFFVDHFSAFRLDISDHYVVITKEDKEASALRADFGTYFYDSYKDDVRLAERQSREMTHCETLEFLGPIDETKLREAIKCTDIFDEMKLPELDLTKLLKSINDSKDPYKG